MIIARGQITVAIVEDGATGDPGADGRGVSGISEQYYLSTSKTTTIGGSWSDTKPTWSAGKYVWIRTKVTYTSGTPNPTYTAPYCDSSWEVVNDIEVGTVNLLSGASNGLGWVSVGGFENNVFNKVLPSDTTETYIYSAYLPLLEVSAKYLLVFEVKAEGDFNRNEIYILSNKYSTNGAIFNSVYSGVTSSYKKVVIPFTPDADFQGLTDVRVRFDIDKTSGTRNGAQLWIKEAMLIKGNIVPQSFLIPLNDIFKKVSDAQAVADAITKKATDEGWAMKLTHIDESGIFTGTLSSNTVNAIRINASQITAGTISAARIDTVALKSTLITASNINALTLDVIRGKIGGWNIASGVLSSSNILLDSTHKRVVVYGESSSATSGHRAQLYYNNNNDFGFFASNSSGSAVAQFGSTNRVAGWNITTNAIYKNSIYLGSDGSIYNNSNKWKLANDGSGRLANGNISWDTAGNITFSSAVSLNWSVPIAEINELLDDTVTPKLTKLTSTGIYTGTLTASQVNAVSISATSITTGTLSADRIAAGSISASKLNATSIKSEIINTSYINGLSCTFTKGTIGGWRIESGKITNSNIAIDNSNRRIAVFATGSSATSGHRLQLYYGSNTNFGFYATNSAGSCIAQLGSSNHISGWQINSGYIKKNNVYLGSDGSIYNGSKWRLNNDGSGSIASGNISWNTAGAITFSNAVSLQWKADIEEAKTENLGYPYYQSIVINGDEDKFYPVILKGGDQNVKRDILIRRGYNEQAPDSWHNTTHHGGLILHLKTNFGGWGGINYSWDIYELSELYCNMFAGAQLVGNCCMFAIFLRGGGTTGAKYQIYSDQAIVNDMYSPSPIPAAPQIAYNSDKIFQSGSTVANAPAPRTLTDSVREEIRTHRFIGLAQSNDSTLKAHPLTYIGSTGIYTGTLTANQVNAVAISATSITTGTLSASRIAAGSIDATKLNADSIKANIINTSYINGLSCTFTKGTIGGWSIGTDNITAGSIGGDGQMPMQLRKTSTGSGYWYSGSYKPFGISMTWHKSANAGHIVIGQVAASGNSVKSGFMGIQMMSWDHNEYFCISANYTRSGSKEVYNRIAGWAFDSANIWKNSVYLGSDGSIYNSSNKWRLSNDGSGSVANGNISWDSSGNVTFSSAVSLKWESGISALEDSLDDNIYPRITKLTSTGIYTGTLTASQITAGTINAARIDVNSIKASIITAANINALTLTTSKGSIGGWSIASSYIKKNSVYLGSDGSIYNGTKWKLNNDGSGQLANGNIRWDTAGSITARNAIFTNVRVQGSVRNPFVYNDSSIWIGGESSNQTNFNNYDNIVATNMGSWGVNIPLPWTLENSGRRITLVNYKWGTTISTGYMDISAPSGKYFYEDGLAKSTIKFSRELIELLGYGDNSTFFGWIVVNRINLMTDYRYGKNLRVIAQGKVTGTSSGASISYKTFDNSTMSVSRVGSGKYKVYFSTAWENTASNLIIMLTGYGYSYGHSSASIKASVYGIYDGYFYVNTSDDASNNDGSFFFQITNKNEWTY